MLSEEEIFINKIAQDKLTLDDGLTWFRNCNPSERRKILGYLQFYLEQSRPTQQLIDDGLENVPLKPTMTPVVLFSNYPYKIAAAKVCNLGESEFEKSFITLLTLLKYTDTKRRETFCKDDCTHEWHNLDQNFA